MFDTASMNAHTVQAFLEVLSYAWPFLLAGIAVRWYFGR
jgi:hypothetical protein